MVSNRITPIIQVTSRPGDVKNVFNTSATTSSTSSATDGTAADSTAARIYMVS